MFRQLKDLVRDPGVLMQCTDYHETTSHEAEQAGRRVLAPSSRGVPAPKGCELLLVVFGLNEVIYG